MAGRVDAPGRHRCPMSATSMTFPRSRSDNLWDDTQSGVADRQDLCRPDQHQGHRALHAHDAPTPATSSSTPPAARHDRLRGRAVGPPLDHHRHRRGRAGARAAATDGREVSRTTCSRTPEGGEGGRADGKRRRPAHDQRRHPHGFVYERVPHVTLKSIANNPDIKEGMTPRGDRRGDQAPRRHRDCSTTSPTKTTSASASPARSPSRACRPHRVAGFGRRPTPASGARGGGATRCRRAKVRADDPRQPAQGRRAERAARTSGSSSRARALRRALHPGRWATYTDAEGERPAGRRLRSAPVRHGQPDVRARRPPGRRCRASASTCSASRLRLRPARCRRGRRSRVTGEGFDACCRAPGRIQVLMVRMNADLLMGEELKKTGAGNLFTVFGEPDIEIETRPTTTIVVTSRASTSTTRPPARSAATTPTRSRSG